MRDASIPMVVIGIPLMLIVQVASQAITHWRLTEVENSVEQLEGRGRTLGEGLANVRSDLKGYAQTLKRFDDHYRDLGDRYPPIIDENSKAVEKLRKCPRSRKCFE